MSYARNVQPKPWARCVVDAESLVIHSRSEGSNAGCQIRFLRSVALSIVAPVVDHVTGNLAYLYWQPSNTGVATPSQHMSLLRTATTLRSIPKLAQTLPAFSATRPFSLTAKLGSAASTPVDMGAIKEKVDSAIKDHDVVVFGKSWCSVRGLPASG